MSREWLPGDVFVSRLEEPPYLVEDVREFMDELVAWWPRRPLPEVGGVGKAGGTGMFKWFARLVESAQVGPLVIIDPEDREQVRRLRKSFRDEGGHTPGHDGVEAMQAALRSLIAPPKPDEPLGLGAVVRCANDDYWTRNAAGLWMNLDGGTSWIKWEDLSAVRVLSEGVVA